MEDKAQPTKEVGYVKLYKNSRGYNWEIKEYLDTDHTALKALAEGLEEIDAIFKNKFEISE